MAQWPVSCEQEKSLLQRRKTALLGWRVTETFPFKKGRKKIPANMTRANDLKKF
jgi:hypothetical protein